MKLRVDYHYFVGKLINILKIPSHSHPPKKKFGTIPFSQAVLVSDQNTYTQGLLADTTALYSDRQKFIFHAEEQPF
jgi:hypothetical protein